MNALLTIVVTMGVGTGCASAPASGPDSGGATVGRAGPESAAGAATAADSTAPAADTAADTANATPVDRTIPPDYLPPPGQCRIWVPGEPPERQRTNHPVGRCSDLRLTVPEHAWLIYHPMDGRKQVRVWQYGSERQVLFQRYYDVTTGELIRHGAPASGD